MTQINPPAACRRRAPSPASCSLRPSGSRCGRSPHQRSSQHGSVGRVRDPRRARPRRAGGCPRDQARHAPAERVHERRLSERSGWNVSEVQTKLTKPIQTDDGPVNQEVSQIIWTWTGPLGPRRQRPVHRLPPVGRDSRDAAGKTLKFKAVQSYSNGQIVRWIEPSLNDPNPAPTINVTAKGGVIEDVAGAEAGPEPAQTGAGGAAANRLHATSNGGTSNGLAIAALIVGALRTRARRFGRSSYTAAPPHTRCSDAEARSPPSSATPHRESVHLTRMAEPLRRVGRYELLEVIGRGGAAVVYLARQPDLDRRVALKELSPHHAGDPSFAHRFVEESRLAGAMSHPSIVTVHEYFEHDGLPYIAMEYLPRGSLRPYLATLTSPQLAGMLEDVLAGLAHGAGHGVIHRDLKPENLVGRGRRSRQDRRLRGRASAWQRRRTAVRDGHRHDDRYPRVYGPEQALGEPLSPATDLYSLGIIVWEALAGHTPFESRETPMAVLYRQVHDPVPAIDTVRPTSTRRCRSGWRRCSPRRRASASRRPNPRGTSWRMWSSSSPGRAGAARRGSVASRRRGRGRIPPR